MGGGNNKNNKNSTKGGGGTPGTNGGSGSSNKGSNVPRTNNNRTSNIANTKNLQLLHAPISPLSKKKFRSISIQETDLSIRSCNTSSESSNSSDGTYATLMMSDFVNGKGASCMLLDPPQLPTLNNPTKNKNKQESSKTTVKSKGASKSQFTKEVSKKVSSMDLFSSTVEEEVEEMIQYNHHVYSSPLYVTGSEILTLFLIVLGFASFSIIIGMAAGMSISIQFHDETSETSSVSLFKYPSFWSTTHQNHQYHHQRHFLYDTATISLDSILNPNQHTTNIDPMIAYSTSSPYRTNHRFHHNVRDFQPAVSQQASRSGSKTLFEGSETKQQKGSNQMSAHSDRTATLVSNHSKTISFGYSECPSLSEIDENEINGTSSKNSFFCQQHSLVSSWNPHGINDAHIPVLHNDEQLEEYRNVQHNGDFDFDEDFEAEDYFSDDLLPSPPDIPRFWDWTTVPPSLCSDGRTMGFDTIESLHAAIQEANYYSAERAIRWNDYYAIVARRSGIEGFSLDDIRGDLIYYDMDTDSVLNDIDIDLSSKMATLPLSWPSAFQDNSLYFDEDLVFTICPGIVLSLTKHSHDKYHSGRYLHPSMAYNYPPNPYSSSLLPIYVNSENVVVECDGCVFDISGSIAKYNGKEYQKRSTYNTRNRDSDQTISDLSGSHFAFGPNAKNILMRGILFKGATTSSMTFYHDGADVSFEDCSFEKNTARYANWGGVADINSSSVVNFYRCFVTKKSVKSVLSSSTVLKNNQQQLNHKKMKRGTCRHKNCRNGHQSHQVLNGIDGSLSLSIRLP